MQLKIKRLPNLHDLPLPKYQSMGASGLDLVAAIDQDIIIPPNGRVLIPTGISIELPAGAEAQVRPRSGNAFKIGLTSIFGTVDSDYRGEIKVIAHNLNYPNIKEMLYLGGLVANNAQDNAKLIDELIEKYSLTVKRGDREAQLVIAPVQEVELIETEELYETKRGSKGFGSTGV